MIRFKQVQLKEILDKGHCRINEKTSVKVSLKRKDGKPPKGKLPQDILTQAITSRWGDRAHLEYQAIPERKFRIDIAFPEEKLAIECDGWSYHGRFKEDFKKGLRRQNILSENGWSFLRFTADDIFNHLDECLSMVERAVNC